MLKKAIGSFRKNKLKALGLMVCSSALFQAGNVHGDWTRFRGPNGTGIAEGTAPTEWSEAKNLKWKVELPGAGVSSPIVVGDKVFVTAYSGYGVSRDDLGEMKDLTRHLVCVSAASGDVLWKKDIPNEVREDPYSGMGIPAHGYASHTPTSDGEHVFAFFGKTGVIAYDMEGQEVWRKSLGTDSDPKEWGSASSPIVHKDVLVVTAGPESRAVVGLDKKTGKELWRADADGFGNVWGTPAVAKSGELEDIVIGAPWEIWALNPKNGKLTWYCEGVPADSFNTSVVVADDTVYAIEGRRGGGSIAVKAGGKDDVTKDNVVWSGRDGGGFATPVVYKGRIYQFANGIFSCLDAKTGDEVFKARLKSPSGNEDGGNGGRGGPGGFGGPGGGGPGGFGGGPGGPGGGGRGGFGGRGGGRGGFGGGGFDYPSPVVAGDHIYYLKGNGEMYVFKAGDEMDQVAVNKVTSGSETFGGTPAISDGKIFLRSNKHLYCVSAE